MNEAFVLCFDEPDLETEFPELNFGIKACSNQA